MDDIDVLEGVSDLVAGCGDTELISLLNRHNYQRLVASAKEAVALEDCPEHEELLHRISDDLLQLSREICELAEAQSVPFHAHDPTAMEAFLARHPGTIDQREKVYNFIGSAASNLSLKFLRHVVKLLSAAQQ